MLFLLLHVASCEAVITTLSEIISQHGFEMLAEPKERFTFEFRKVIGFASTTLHDWLKTRATFSSNQQ